MIFCRAFRYPTVVPTNYGWAVAMATVRGIHLSAANQKNAVFVFERNLKTDNLEIYKYITNLTFEPEEAT